MARKDDIFISFIKNELISNQFDIINVPKNLREGLSSNDVIIKTIALIVENVEKHNPDTEKSLYAKLTQFLNEKAI